ncbi:MAG TPA: hypothetical protein PK393_11105 [Synergistaceae bacterium]|nr:hypothetical protein [Synergistaceae bacterium]
MGTMMFLRDYAVRRFVEGARRLNRLKTPMDVVLETAELYGFPCHHMAALDVFARMGLINTRDFEPRCDYLECWEIDPKIIPWLRRFVPRATVREGDSIAATRERRHARSHYDLIVLDNPPCLFGHGYCEHFDHFPDILDYGAPRCVVAFDIIPDLRNANSGSPGEPYFEQWRQRRREFYPGSDGVTVPVDHAREVYRTMMISRGFRVVGETLVPRNRMVTFLGYFLERP